MMYQQPPERSYVLFIIILWIDSIYGKLLKSELNVNAMLYEYLTLS